MPNFNWSQLNHLQIGRYAEYYVKMELSSYGFHIFTSEVDDHGVDFVMKNSSSNFYEVQVKAIRLNTSVKPTKEKQVPKIKTSSYIFADKKKFDITSKILYMAVVILDEGRAPLLYLIPATTWLIETDLFRNRDFTGKKSKPEWGLNISKKNMYLLNEFLIENLGEKLYLT